MEMLGCNPNTNYTRGYTCKAKDGTICLSVSECIIHNYLIDNNINIIAKEYYYKNLVEDNEELKKFILDVIEKTKSDNVKDLKIDLRVNEVKNPELSAYLVASRIASELERRIPHRRSITKAMDRVMMAGAGGIKVVLGGRINGAEISRVEKFHLGSVPTQTLREDIDYGEIPALTKRGYVGVKVWIHRKES